MAQDHALTTASAGLLALLPALALAPAAAAAGAVCPDTDSVALIAGKDIPVGDVKVCNDAETLTITYEPTGPWCVADTDLHVATGRDGIPQTNSGSPKPDEFAYGGPPDWDECTVTFEIPLDEIGAEGVAAEDTVWIAAQADLLNLTTLQQEGAWAAGMRFTERGNWATYFTYTVEEASFLCGGEDSKCVFVTSTTYNGNLGGLSGADAKCQALANAAGSLAAPGTYKAWLSDDSSSPSDRFTHAAVPYRLVNDTAIATDWNDLTKGSLRAPINVDQAGHHVGGWPLVWTATSENGLYPNIVHCQNWLSGASGSRGAAGVPTDTVTWSHNTFGYSCAEQFRLYCFQQQ